MKKWMAMTGLGASLALLAMVTTGRPQAQQGGTLRVDSDDIGGVVTSAKGPEAGVWVIAETRDLPTALNKTVVTDDQGRYVIPDLPKASYQVWVRGYGLVDSPKVTASPGASLNLTAVVAANARAAAEYYPANYWFALLHLPDKREFPGTGPAGNGIAETMRTQADWINNIKTTSCTPCHQLGNKATREIPASLRTFGSSADSWDHRLRSGFDGGANMSAYTGRFGRQRLFTMLADWSDRIAAGEYPRVAPPRPQGVERNFVITQWDWADAREYFHDAVASDKRNPAVNANGPIYGVHEISSDHLTVLDPTRHIATQLTLPVQEPPPPPVYARMGAPSPYWGEETYWSSRTNAHSNVMDQKGRVWNTSITRPIENPAWCRAGSAHPSARHFPLDRAGTGRQYAVYDQASTRFSIVDTCYGTFHLNFAHDANNTLWTAEMGVVGWLNTRQLDDTGDAQQAQGWAPLIVDTNGNGKQDAWVEPGQPIDPAKDARIDASFYGISVSPVDGSVWGNTNAFPGAAFRVTPGPNPPFTTLTEVFEIPYGRVPGAGYNPRGMDVDAEGVFWTVLASGHFASFDRRTCKGALTGPQAAAGKHCPEGWAFHPVPGPNFAGNPESAAADSNYYNWVDKYNTLGLGKNMPVATGNLSDSLLFLRDGRWVTLRVPYPMGFFVKQLDGRVDDPKAGWKGTGVWTTSANRTPWHLEGGKGTRPKVIKLQLRPDPLAR